MRRDRTHLLIAAVALAMSMCVGTTGCGASVGAPCSFDSDCGAEAACVGEVCRTICSDDDDCVTEQEREPDEEIACRPVMRQMESINVCGPPDLTDDNSDTDPECTRDAQCRALLEDDRARCSLINRCVIPQLQYGVLVSDLGEPEAGPPGAQILDVHLERDGAIIGYGVIEDLSLANDVSGEGAALPGAAVVFSAEMAQCVEGYDAAATPSVPLGGMGGFVRASFVNDVGERVTPQAGMDVVVVERGMNCADTEVSNEFRVALCVSPRQEDLNETTQCTTELAGRTSGFARLPIERLPE